jgi:hypothetical protein
LENSFSLSLWLSLPISLSLSFLLFVFLTLGGDFIWVSDDANYSSFELSWIESFFLKIAAIELYDKSMFFYLSCFNFRFGVVGGTSGLIISAVT